MNRMCCLYYYEFDMFEWCWSRAIGVESVVDIVMFNELYMFGRGIESVVAKMFRCLGGVAASPRGI